MPSTSKAQRSAAALALQVKKGEKDKEDLTGAAKSMLSMSKEELEEYASTSEEDLPDKKEDDSDNKKQGSEDNPLNQFLQQRQQEKQSVRKQAEEIVNHRLRNITSK